MILDTPLAWALHYASHELPVIPLRRLGNVPHSELLGSGWTFETVGSTRSSQVHAWWAADPAANIGVVTGARSGVLVLDIDKKTVDGEISLATWLNEHEISLYGCPKVRTPSGGTHLWLRLPPGCDVRRKIGWLPGVDACGSGGFVAVPPSVRLVSSRSPKPWEPVTPELREYEWLSAGLLTFDAPLALLEDIQTRPPTITRADGTRELASSGSLPLTEEFLARGLGWFTGSRNRDCFRLAWRLWAAGLGELEVVSIFVHILEKTPQSPHPFTWAECYKTIISAGQRHDRTREAERAEALETLRRWQSR